MAEGEKSLPIRENNRMGRSQGREKERKKRVNERKED